MAGNRAKLVTAYSLLGSSDHIMVNDIAAIPKESRWRSQDQPSPIVISIIRRRISDRDGEGMYRYLLIKRTKGPYRDYWALVGGKWDFGETLKDAALREVAEETGLQCSFHALSGIANERALSVSHDETTGAHFLLFVCLVDACDGAAEEQDEGAVQWFSSAEIEMLNERNEIIPSDYAMLAQFMNAEALPYVEVDMESSGEIRQTSGTTRLLKFEVNR